MGRLNDYYNNEKKQFNPVCAICKINKNIDIGKNIVISDCKDLLSNTLEDIDIIQNERKIDVKQHALITERDNLNNKINTADSLLALASKNK